MPGEATITLRDRQWQIGIADTPRELMEGLAGVPWLPPWTGMLFDTGVTQVIQVTTISMLFPIDIAFLSEALVVTEVYRDIEPGYIVTSTEPARYFLEVNAGELEGIDSGDKASIEFLPVPVDIGTSSPVWMSAMVSFMGFAITAVFFTAIARELVKTALKPPEERPVLYGPRGERLLPKTEKPEYEKMAYELLENPEFWFDVYRVKDLANVSHAEASRVMEVLGDEEFLAKAKSFYQGMRYPPRAALHNIKTIEEEIEGGATLMPQVEPVENEDIGLPIPFTRAGIDWARWETTLADKTVAVEVTGIRGLTRAQLEDAFVQSTAWVPYLAPGQRLPFAAAARRHLWWLATIDDKSVEVHVAGIRGLTATQLEDAFVDSVAVMDVGPGIAVHAHATAKPTRDDLKIGTWVERDRIGIWVTDKRIDKTIAEWWDEDAREMFEHGWFKPGDIRHQTIIGRRFEESVLDYLEHIGLLTGSSRYLPQTKRDAYYWTAINKGTSEIVESFTPYTSSGRALRGGRAYASRHWRDDALVEVWRQPHRYSEKLEIQPVASEVVPAKDRSLPEARGAEEELAMRAIEEAFEEYMLGEEVTEWAKEHVRSAIREGRKQEGPLPATLPQTVPLTIEEVERRTRRYADSLWDAYRKYRDRLEGMARRYHQATERAIRNYREWLLAEYEKRKVAVPGAGKHKVERPAVIPVEPRPRRPREELEFLPDSPEVIAQTIDAIGYREQIDTAFMEAIKRAKGLI